jgi:hypothetical protein
MDKPIIPDLAEAPKRRERSPEEVLQRKWHLALSLFAAAMLYALIHKLFVPLGVNFLGTTRSEYGKVGWDVLWVLLLGIFLHKDAGISKRIHFFMGASMGFVFYEIIIIFLGSRQGWLLFSHLLSSIPLGISLLLLAKFSTLKLSQKVVLGFSGFITFFVSGGLLWKLAH